MYWKLGKLIVSDRDDPVAALAIGLSGSSPPPRQFLLQPLQFLLSKSLNHKWKIIADTLYYATSIVASQDKIAILKLGTV